jgi:Ser/Thr protein kinase RdoA (MazF antagonist)
MEKARKAAENFISQPGSTVSVEEYGRGIINDTFLVSFSSPNLNIILQRINPEVFRHPVLIMHNLRLLCNHVHDPDNVRRCGLAPDWRMVQIVPALDSKDYFVDPDGDFWRALTYIPARPIEKITSLDEAGEIGRGLGSFHCSSDALDPEHFEDTLPGFHNMVHYLELYDRVIERTGPDLHDKDIDFCRRFIEARRSWSSVLEDALQQDKLHKRIIHGDPKISNFLLDEKSGRAVSIIDLDTVKPGLLLYDMGDCLRSCCAIPGQEDADTDEVSFDVGRCGAMLSGYMNEAPDIPTENDLNLLFEAVRLIPFELGLRFFTDYLEGNIYFKVSFPEQNLKRSITQFRLVESIEQQETAIREVIEKFRPV